MMDFYCLITVCLNCFDNESGVLHFDLPELGVECYITSLKTLNGDISTSTDKTAFISLPLKKVLPLLKSSQLYNKHKIQM